MLKSCSYWARNNPVKARWIIAAAHIAGVLNAYCLRLLGYLEDWHWPLWITPVALSVFFLAYWFYPDPKRRNQPSLFAYSWGRQKLADALLILSAWILIVSGTNGLPQPEIAAQPRAVPAALHWTPDQAIKATPEKEFFKTARHKVKSELKALKADWKKHKKEGDTAGKVALVILTILLGLVLLYGLVLLSCSISCSGNEGLAIVVLIGGLAGIIVGTVFAIRAILRRMGDGM